MFYDTVYLKGPHWYLIRVPVSECDDFENNCDVTSLTSWSHVTWRRWRHQSTRCRHFSIGFVLDTNPWTGLVYEIFCIEFVDPDRHIDTSTDNKDRLKLSSEPIIKTTSGGYQEQCHQCRPPMTSSWIIGHTHAHNINTDEKNLKEWARQRTIILLLTYASNYKYSPNCCFEL